MQEAALLLDNVSKRFGATAAVDNLSLRVPAGTVYGFLGPNGAGKTTTIRMIMNIIIPDSGRIEIAGCRTSNDVRERIGYMPEERGLYRKMTVRKVLAFLGAMKGMGRDAIRRAIPYWLELVGLADRADSRMEELSRGMQQKIQFIATVLNDPPIMILDEPFAGLDPVNLDLIKGVMLRVRQMGKTVLFSTHMMEQAERMCDSILLINQGQKVIDGTVDEVRGQYRTNIVSAELEGPTDFLEALNGVLAVRRDGRRTEIDLAETADPQNLLRAFLDHGVRVRAFEVKVPSLHEIFIQLVGRHDA
jgi:ABC-2 type transport system ATP-binding protein